MGPKMQKDKKINFNSYKTVEVQKKKSLGVRGPGLASAIWRSLGLRTHTTTNRSLVGSVLTKPSLDMSLEA